MVPVPGSEGFVGTNSAGLYNSSLSSPLKVGNLDGLSVEQLAQREVAFDFHKTAVDSEWKENKEKAIEICKATGWILSLQNRRDSLTDRYSIMICYALLLYPLRIYIHH